MRYRDVSVFKIMAVRRFGFLKLVFNTHAVQGYVLYHRDILWRSFIRSAIAQFFAFSPVKCKNSLGDTVIALNMA